MTFPNDDFLISSSTKSVSNTIDKVIIDDTFILSSYSKGSSNLTDPLSFDFSNNDFSHVDGTGQTIVIIDSGIDLNHPAFGPDNNGDGISDRIIAYKSFVPGQSVDYISTRDHGSHVAGILLHLMICILGSLCKYYCIKALDSFSEVEITHG